MDSHFTKNNDKERVIVTQIKFFFKVQSGIGT